VDTPTTSPLSTPPTRQRRRVSDSSVVMRVEPGRACRGRGASLAGITSKGTGSPPLWVGSPVYTGGVGGEQQQQSKAAKQSSSKQQSNTKQQQQQRQRKPSIFLHTDQRLAAVEESVKEMNSMLNGADDTAILTALMSQATSRQSSVEPPVKNLPQPDSSRNPRSSGRRPDAETEYWSMGREGAMLEHVYSEVGQPENDYSEPLDSLGRLQTSRGAEEQRRSDEEELRWKLRRERFSEGSLGSFRQKESTSELGEGVRGKRKLSLGQFVRKLSRGSLGGEGQGGERLSKLVSRLVGVRRLGSQQVDSSSWEFLSAADSSTNSTPTSTHKSNSTSAHRSDSTSLHKISTTSSPFVGSTPMERESKSPARTRDSIHEESRSSTSKGGNFKSNRKRLGGSRDSVYESEYDSSTGSSLTSQDSALSPSSTQSSSHQLGQNRALPLLLQ